MRHDLGYLIIDPAEYNRYTLDKPILAALRPTDLDLFNDYTVLQQAVAPGGQVEFVVAEVRARKRFLTNWLVLGLWANDGGEGVKKDFIDIHHLTKDHYQGSFGDAFWRQINPQFVRVDLNRFFNAGDPRNPGNPEHVCAYAAMTVRSPQAQSAFFELSGSDDYIQVWLNGNSLTPWPIMLEDKPKRRPIELNAGSNLLMVKSCENVGGWEFTARITDADGKDLPNISATPEIPEGSVAPAPLQADAHVQVVEGFDTVVTFKHTSDSYPDYRGKSESWWVNVGDNAPELVWRTAPPPHKERTVFVLTASSSDESGEAELYVNGTYALTFNIGAHLGSRSWERGAYHMTFASKQSIAGNSGIVLLDVPADQITPGKPVEIRVIPTKGTGDPWFMIKSYRDTIAHEQITPQLAADAIRGAWKSEAAAVAP